MREDGFSGVESVGFLSGPPPPRSSWVPFGTSALWFILEFLGDFKSPNLYLESLKYGIGGNIWSTGHDRNQKKAKIQYGVLSRYHAKGKC